MAWRKLRIHYKLSLNEYSNINQRDGNDNTDDGMSNFVTCVRDSDDNSDGSIQT